MIDTNKYKRKLEELEKDLKAHIAQIDAGGSFGDDIDGGDEDADEAEQISANLGVRESFEERLIQTEDALHKIKEGTYGICESCGQTIESEILDIDPESGLCKTCKRSEKGL